MYCKYCGKLIDDDSSFCKFCGKSLDSPTKDTTIKNEKVESLPSEEHVFSEENAGSRTNDIIVKPNNPNNEVNRTLHRHDIQTIINEEPKDGFKVTNDDNNGSIDEKNANNSEDALKESLIESKIGTSNFTQEEFEWHSKRICWGCGKRHIMPFIPYLYRTKKNKRRREGAAKYTESIS